MLNMQFRYARCEHNVTNLGPGRRTVIWAQGCYRNCKNCVGQNYRDINGGQRIATDKFVEQLISNKDFSPEITISGGEPFLQAGAFSVILDELKKHFNIGVIVYTGYTLEELLEQDDASINGFLEKIDLLIDGIYIEELDCNEIIRGSTNQKLTYMSEKYKTEDMELYKSIPRGAFIDIEADEMKMIGIPTKMDMNRWNKLVALAEKTIGGEKET